MRQSNLDDALNILESSFDPEVKDLGSPLHVNTDLAIIISDVHIPFHSKPWLKRALIVAYDLKKLNPSKKLTLVIAGDFLDFTMFSDFGIDDRDINFRKSIAMGSQVLASFAKMCDFIVVTPGNHDMRLVKKMKKMTGGFGFREIMQLMLSEEILRPVLGKFSHSGRNFCIINNQWAAVHPVSYSKIPGKVGLDLAVRHQVNIINGHTHHPPAVMPSPCGKFVALENGCMSDSTAQGYLQNMTTFPQHVNGFTILMKCKDKTRFKQISAQDIRL